MPASVRAQDSTIRPGDIVFQAINTKQTEALIAATGSIYTHCGVVIEKEGGLFVLEALLKMSETPLDQWLARGDSNYVVMRLKEAENILTEKALGDLSMAFHQFDELTYDLYFEWSDERMYCSELVWKIFENGLGLVLVPLKKIGDYDLKSSAVTAIISERFTGNLDLDEPAVSPADLLDSPLLVRIK
ncbi:MAG: hypothetical protein LBE31_09025 [Deltaproteobacteria bacterium]|nr:hypothetical protein [Deltaproteobacteria bacterium]